MPIFVSKYNSLEKSGSPWIFEPYGLRQLGPFPACLLLLAYFFEISISKNWAL